MLTLSEYLNQLWKINKQDSHRLKSQELPTPSSSLYNNKPRDSIQLPFLWIFPIDCCKMQCIKVLMLITNECVWLEELWGEAQLSHQCCDPKKPLHPDGSSVSLSSRVPRAPDLHPGQEVALPSEGALSIWAPTATHMGVLLGGEGAGPEVSLHWLHLISHGLMQSKSWHFLSFTGRIGRRQHHFWPWYQCPLPLQFRDMCSVHVSE